MKYNIVLQVLGDLLVGLACCITLPFMISLKYPSMEHANEPRAFAYTLLITLSAGLILKLTNKCNWREMRIREAFVIVPLAWILLAAFGALPFVFTDNVLTLYTDAYFETMSGFTTTGATVFGDSTCSIESLPKGILLWRSTCHYLGGMGIIVLSVALLSFGASGFQMLRAEVPGPTADRLTPRITVTAKLLWGTYLLLTAAEILMLSLGEMDLFEATCHAFSTMATGGFSTKDTSILNYSSYTHWVISGFMFLAGINFVLHYKLLRGNPKPFLKSTEFRVYLSIVLIASLSFATILLISGNGDYEWKHFDEVLRDSFFTVISIVTSTGFCTANFDVWPNALRISLFLLMWCGACSGSTGGGLKVLRIIMVVKLGWREIKRLIHPRMFSPIKLDGEIVEDKMLTGIIGVVLLYGVSFVVFSIIMCFIIHIPEQTPSYNMETAVTSVVACLSNIGPGLSGVGATQNYGFITPSGKWILSFCMLLGRLEIYSVLLLLLPSTWKK